MPKPAKLKPRGEEWIRPGDVEKLVVTSHKLGEGSYGTVYLGTLTKNGRTKQVAVKEFKPDSSLSDSEGRAYVQAIKDLRGQGIPLKMAVLKHDGNYVLVSKARVTSAEDGPIRPRLRDQILNRHHQIMPAKWNRFSKETKKDTLQLIAKIVNADRFPERDAIAVLSSKTADGIQ